MATEDDAEMPNPCAECGGKCCSFRLGGISYSGLDKGERYDSHFLDGDHTDQLVFADGTVPEMNWFVVTHPNGARDLSFECTHLTDDGKCGAYDKRPGMCRGFQCPAVDEDDDTTLSEWLDTFARDDGVPDEYDVRDVTERVRSIIRRRSEANDWPTEDTVGFDGDTWSPASDDEDGDGDE